MERSREGAHRPHRQFVGHSEPKIEVGELLRAGWEDAAARVAAEGGDELLLGEFPNEWDDEAWTWLGEKA